MNAVNDVFFWSFNNTNPTGYGITEIGSGAMMRITPTRDGGHMLCYKLRWYPDTGVLKTFNVVSRPVSHWLSDEAIVTPISRCVKGMVKTGEAGKAIEDELPIPNIFFSVDMDSFVPDIHEESTAALVAFTFSPDNPDLTPPASTMLTGPGVISLVEKEVGSTNKLVALDTGEALTLPPTAVLRPWVRKDAVVQSEVCAADLVPRRRYTIQDILGMPEATQDMLLEHVIDRNSFALPDGRIVMDYGLVPSHLRLGVDFGGVVTGAFELSVEARQPVLSSVRSVDTDLGTLEFYKDSFQKGRRR